MRSCRFCGAIDVVKAGVGRSLKHPSQRYRCKVCGKRFVENTGFLKMKSSAEAITTASDLYFKGVSLRKITDHLQQFYSKKVHYVTVLRWIRKYSKMIKDYTSQLVPKVGEKWHVDETILKCKDSRNLWLWYWDCIDPKTRFLVAQILSAHRNERDAKALCLQARHNAMAKPQQFVTDGLFDYGAPVRFHFGLRMEHVKGIGDRKFLVNNVMERLQGTIKDRHKVMRGFSRLESAKEIMDGRTIYYNFLRPHLALDGKTPAEEAGIKLFHHENENRWKNLIGQNINVNKMHERMRQFIES